jgi:hypothetical protein
VTEKLRREADAYLSAARLADPVIAGRNIEVARVLRRIADELESDHVSTARPTPDAPR